MGRAVSLPRSLLPPIFPGVQGLTARARTLPKGWVWDLTRLRTGAVEEPALTQRPCACLCRAVSPGQAVLGQSHPLPTKERPEHPKTVAAPGRKAGSSGPEAAQASSSHFLPWYQSHGAVFHLTLPSAPSRLCLNRAAAGRITSTRAHAGTRPSPRATCLGAAPHTLAKAGAQFRGESPKSLAQGGWRPQ